VTNQITLPSIYFLYAITFLRGCMFYSFIFHTVEQKWLLRPPPAPHFSALQLFMICFLKCAMFSTININCYKCSSLLISSKKLSPICCWKMFRILECNFCQDKIRFNFPCAVYIISYHARQIYLISKFCNCFYFSCLLLGYLLLDLFSLFFFHIHFNSITSFILNCYINDAV